MTTCAMRIRPLDAEDHLEPPMPRLRRSTAAVAHATGSANSVNGEPAYGRTCWVLGTDWHIALPGLAMVRLFHFNLPDESCLTTQLFAPIGLGHEVLAVADLFPRADDESVIGLALRARQPMCPPRNPIVVGQGLRSVRFMPMDLNSTGVVRATLLDSVPA